MVRLRSPAIVKAHPKCTVVSDLTQLQARRFPVFMQEQPAVQETGAHFDSLSFQQHIKTHESKFFSDHHHLHIERKSIIIERFEARAQQSMQPSLMLFLITSAAQSVCDHNRQGTSALPLLYTSEKRFHSMRSRSHRAIVAFTGVNLYNNGETPKLVTRFCSSHHPADGSDLTRMGRQTWHPRHERITDRVHVLRRARSWPILQGFAHFVANKQIDRAALRVLAPSVALSRKCPSHLDLLNAS